MPVVHRAARLALAMAAGAALALSFPEAGIWPLALPALATGLALATSAAPRRAAFEGFLLAFVFHGLLLQWFAAVLLDFSTLGSTIAAAAVLASATILGAIGASWGFLASRLAHRFGLETGLAGGALLWCGIELMRVTFPFPFPWGTLAAAHAELPLAARLASLGGSWSISLVAALGAASFVLAIRARKSGWAGIASLGGILLIAWWTAPLALPADEGRVRVGVVQASLSRDADPYDELVAYETLTREAAREGARLVVWPESAVSYRVDGAPAYRARLEDLARALDVDIVVTSVTRGEGDEYFNSAALVRPTLGLAGTYAKRQLVPFGEYLPLRWLFGQVPALAAEAGDFTPGESVTLLPSRVGRLGPLVCFESVFPELGNEAARRGARLLVTMTNDSWFGWTSGPRQHLQHGLLRAAESGLPLLRAANTGISAIADRRGRVQGELPLGARGVIVHEVAIGAPAWGASVGRVVSGACATLSVAFALLGIWPARRREEKPDPTNPSRDFRRPLEPMAPRSLDATGLPDEECDDAR